MVFFSVMAQGPGGLNSSINIFSLKNLGLNMGNTHWGLGIRLIFMMMMMICIFLVKVALGGGGGNLTTAACSEQERLALLKFKHSIKDDHGMLSSWGVVNDCCRWERVGCDDATGKVVSLHLSAHLRPDYMYVDSVDNYYLAGDEVNYYCLTELVSLKHLDLSGNFFPYTRIPKFIGSLKQLRYLNLSGAGFSGDIPHQIGNLSNLKVLDLSEPSISNPKLRIHDMAWICSLSKLEHLDLSGVDLSRAQNLDKILYTMPSLFKLSLSGCDLSTTHHLGSHYRNSSRELQGMIKHLDLSENFFKGQLPTLFLNITSLAVLDLSWNIDLSMVWIFEKLLNIIPFVSELRLSGCGLRKINLSPPHLNFSAHSSNIQHLDLSSNEIEGRFPYVLTNMSSLLSLDMSDNMLNSSIPIMPNLLRLDISRNRYRQIEDVGIWRQCHIKELIVSQNTLEGEMIGPSTNVSKCSPNALEVLHLDQNRFNCSIPESLGRFINLRDLDLSLNEFTGPIPEALGKLISLQRLDLSYNQLNNSIPESLGRLRALTEMFLNSNQFTGPIPVSLGGLTSLRMLSVSSNLLNDSIPNSIGQLTKLYLLDVSNNSLQGVVSEAHFANLSMLKYLNANQNNKLFFNISSEWIPPFQLKVVRLSSCKIEDGFPQWFQTQRELKELVLTNASIFGPLPAWLRLLPTIYKLDLSHNKLTGPLTNLPSKVTYARYSRHGLHLQDNLFGGLIPKSLCKRTDLEVLDLSRNRLTGKIPQCLWNISLKVALLGSNRLCGVIPSPLGYSALRWLQLNDNNFNGELPQDFGFFGGLVVLDLGENKISGNIPERIGENISSLIILRLHDNNFTGRIPHSLCGCPFLQVLDLAHNNLTGSIPQCVGEFEAMTGQPRLNYYTLKGGFDFSSGNVMQVLKGVALEYTKTLQFVINMDLSSNQLVGKIPEALTTLDALVGLNLSNNHFSGGIPKHIGNMTSLNSLDLSANKLTGMIPPSMAALNFLSYLNLSHNNLSGQIPTGNQLQTLTDPSIYADNPYLCGAPLPKECSPHEKPPTTTSKNKYKNVNEPNKFWFYLDMLSGFATGFWGIIGVLFLKKQWRRKLFMFSEIAMDKIYVAVAIRVFKMKRGREAA